MFIVRAGFGIYPSTGEPEIGFALFEAYQGAGYATEAAAGLRDWFFSAEYPMVRWLEQKLKRPHFR